MAEFIDNFSKQSAIYARYRPHYPQALFDWLASLTAGHDLAFDCGTGNGQAAVSLATHYSKVIATDPSEQQVHNAVPHERVQYMVARAEQAVLGEHSADIITVANAMHWFDLDLFYEEAARVLKPGGVIAAWCYEVPGVNPEINKVLRHYHDVVVDEYWEHANRLVEQRYTTMHFPFPLIDAPAFTSSKMMALEDMLAYLHTWSATQKFINARSHDPVDIIKQDLQAAWGSEQEREVTGRLPMKVGVSG